MDDFNIEMQLAIKQTESRMDLRKRVFDKEHPLNRIEGSKSAIGELGQNLVNIVSGTETSWRDSTENDLIHRKLGKLEIKSAKSSNGRIWVNQIRFNKDWDTLVIVMVTPDTVSAYYAKKSSIEDWDGFFVNNGHSFNGSYELIRQKFKLLFEGSY